jgi:hypothetical protein
MKWVCLVLFGLVGLGAFACGTVWGGKRLRLWRGGLKTTGTVVELFESVSTSKEGGRSTESRSFYPVVEFSAEDGSRHRLRGSTGSSTPSYEVGQSVSLLYSPSDPSSAQIADFEQFWLGPLCLTLFGLLFLAAGVGGFLLIADSDRTFGPAFYAKIARAELYEGKRGIALPATVREVLKKKDGYVLVCRGGIPGAAPRDFEAAPLSFDPGPGVLGKSVTVYAAPDDSKLYYVHVEPLFSSGQRIGL